MELGSNLIGLEQLAVDMGDMGDLDLTHFGIAGLKVTIDKPLSESRSFTVDVTNMGISSIRLGDTSKLGGQGGGGAQSS